METITIGMIVGSLTLIVSIIKSFDFILEKYNKKINDMIDDKLQPLIDKTTENKKANEEEKLHRLKVDLIMYMALADQNLLDEHLKSLAYETFDKYTKLGGNTYIHSYWNKLKEQGKI